MWGGECSCGELMCGGHSNVSTSDLYAAVSTSGVGRAGKLAQRPDECDALANGASCRGAGGLWQAALRR